uniref:Uncharacterized protein n=1 Tax=Octactis speculum TaxID=3111310 RepID=A0A7S2GPH1_9STRA|mmetsp:Transcript_53916/g.73659  ORF Transcript_53916/g.73659 Transcript_53916/m.73659 type:complete len:368 (+) Transcript_53916:18-1121(+)
MEMELKALDDDAARQLISRLTEHAFRVLNVDMDPFFEEHALTFDTPVADLVSGRGHKNELHQVYLLYVEELETHLDEFIQNEGFASSKECFEFIQSAVSRDVIRQKEHMARLQEHLQQMQRSWEAEFNDSETKRNDEEDKCSDDNNDDNDGDGFGMNVPLMLFCQPIGLDTLINSVLSISEYPTFANMMRVKAQQAKLVQKIEDEARQRDVDKVTRAQQLRELRDLDDGNLFGTLRKRVCGLQRRSDMVYQCQAVMDGKTWDAMIIRGDSADGTSKKFLLTLVDFVFHRLMVLSPDEDDKIRNDMIKILDMVWGDPLEDVVTSFLEKAFVYVDAIDNQTAVFIRAQTRAAKDIRKRMAANRGLRIKS